MKTYQVNPTGYYGEFGGADIPEILHRCVHELRSCYVKYIGKRIIPKGIPATSS